MSQTELNVLAAHDEVEAARYAVEVAKAVVPMAESKLRQAVANYVAARANHVNATTLPTPKLPIENAMTLPPEGQSIWIRVDERGGIQISRQPNHAVMVAHWIDSNPPGMPEDCVWFYDHYEREDDPDANYGDPED